MRSIIISSLFEENEYTIKKEAVTIVTASFFLYAVLLLFFLFSQLNTSDFTAYSFW